MENKSFTSKIKAAMQSPTAMVLKKVLWGVIYTLFGALLALVIWLAIDKFILKNPVPSAFGYATLTIETGSMESELLIGDMILIKDTGDYKIGDIITYIKEGDSIPTTHRIIGYTDNGFITKGDNNNAKDTDDVTHDMIFGEVIDVYPKVGLFAKWVQLEGWIYIVSALVILALGTLIVKSADDDQEKNSGEEENTQSPDDNKEEKDDSATQKEVSEDVTDASANENKEEICDSAHISEAEEKIEKTEE